MKTARLSDIAKEIGVSKTAVSRVLNNLPIRISGEKREAITNLAESLGYRPNLIARGLRSRQTRCIGIIVPDMSTLFYPGLIQLIERSLSLRNYRTIICDTEDEIGKERAYIEDLLARQIDGLIIAPASGKGNITIFESLTRNHFPIILMDRYFPGRNLNYVVTDNKAASRRAVRIMSKKKPAHLFYLGERRRNSAVEERLAGVKKEASVKKIPFTGKNIFLCGTNRSEVKRASKQIFSGKAKNPAIFLESNRLLIGLLDAAYEKGLSAPGDFSIMGFDAFRPEITTPLDISSLSVLKEAIYIIGQPISEMAELITEYILSPEKKKKWCVRLPAETIR